MHLLKENGKINALANCQVTKVKTLEIRGRGRSPPLPQVTSSNLSQEYVPIL